MKVAVYSSSASLYARGIEMMLRERQASSGPEERNANITVLELDESDPEVVLVVSHGPADVEAAVECWPHRRRVLLTTGGTLAPDTLLSLYSTRAILGFASASTNLDALVSTLQLVAAGETIVPQSVLEYLLSRPFPEPVEVSNGIGMDIIVPVYRHDFSPREAQVLKLLKQGLSNKQIGRELGRTEATIKVHVKSLLRKLQLRNRTQAAMWGGIAPEGVVS